MRKSPVGFRFRTSVLAVTLALGCSSAFANVYVVDNTSSGWYQYPGYYSPVGDGDYFAGYSLGESAGYNNYFTFDLSGVNGSVLSATFHVATYGIATGGTYAIFATSLLPSQVGTSPGFYDPGYYSELVSGAEIGSINLSESDANSVASIPLNAAGLSFLSANEGNGIVIGGSLVTAIGGSDFAFGQSVFTPSNNLTIDATPINTTPEPALYWPLLAGLGMVAALMRRSSHNQDPKGRSKPGWGAPPVV